MQRLSSVASFVALASIAAPVAGRTLLSEEQIASRVRLLFAPLPERFAHPARPPNAWRVHLGRLLYFDARLSKNHDVSCQSCHPLDRFGADGDAFSTGHRGQLGARNSPTVYNAAPFVAQFWDGRATDLEDQALQPILNPVEMAMPDGDRVVRTLASIPEYVQLFARAFPDDPEPLRYANVGAAIGDFERGLVTPSAFDDYLRGDITALEPRARRGLGRFVSLGCVSCHNGPAVGGASFERLGLIEPYPDRRDPGRSAITLQSADHMRFRVPGLRNVAQTGPWFHDGSVRRLDDAVTLMARHQLGVELAAEEVNEIDAFLATLTGRLPQAYIEPPLLPPSTAATPAPDGR